ncbi:MAG: PAC2 family protein [Nanoarchaeota archaeon]|nr:PAC2 family protein [Nanoarchaeota archaeon]
MVYHIKQLYKKKLKNTILIEGLPGIGNVGKIAMDFIVDNLGAKKMFEIHSDNFPHAVFVNERNLVELPMIDIYHKNIGGDDLLFLAGDIQPIDEPSCYEFCNKILDLLENNNGKEVITMGGIGLQRIPENPVVYCTSNTKSIIKKYKTSNLNNKIYGVVGPIIGVSGLLIGLSKHKKVPAIAMLAETFGHPTYLGIKGARAILEILNHKLGLGLELKQLDEEITEIEKEIKTKTKQLSMLQSGKSHKTDINYIG